MIGTNPRAEQPPRVGFYKQPTDEGLLLDRELPVLEHAGHWVVETKRLPREDGMFVVAWPDGQVCAAPWLGLPDGIVIVDEFYVIGRLEGQLFSVAGVTSLRVAR